MHDAASYLKTFMPLTAILDEECPDDLRNAVFGGRQVIEWYRIHVCACSTVRPCMLRGQALIMCTRRRQAFQLVSLKLLAEQLLLGCQTSGGAAVERIPLYIPGEVPLACLQTAAH